MQEDGFFIMLDAGAKLFHSAVLRGWYHHADDALVRIEVFGRDFIGVKTGVEENYPGFPDGAGYFAWFAQLLHNKAAWPEEMIVNFHAASGHVVRIAADDLLTERRMLNDGAALDHRFFELIKAPGYERVLDLGGRDRSHQHNTLFSDAHKVTVFDIIAAPGVDVVGDAHELSKFFAAGSFDVVHCRSVFEHLAMPWKAAIEVAKVLRCGGVGVFHTHQTVGMHDLPWDFWRFSDSCWDALFNAATGFRIIERALAQECFIIPRQWRPGLESENAAGYEVSSVTVEKIGEPRVDWPVALNEILETQYPA